MKFFIVGNYGNYGKPFIDYGMKEAETAEEADVLVFCVGVDVHPRYYDAEPCYSEFDYDVVRDEKEKQIFDAYPDKWKVGICRGSQFLNVMNGGTLVQNLHNHAIGGEHSTTFNGKQYHVTSTHHQGSILTNHGKLLAESTDKLSKDYLLSPDKRVDDLPEVEAYIYPDSKTIGMQFHTEFVGENHSCAQLFRDILDQEMVA